MATTKKEEQDNVQDLRADMIALGRKMCRDIMDGTARDIHKTTEELAQLYAVLK